MVAVKEGYKPAAKNVTVTYIPHAEAVRLDFELEPNLGDEEDILFDSMVRFFFTLFRVYCFYSDTLHRKLRCKRPKINK